MYDILIPLAEIGVVLAFILCVCAIALVKEKFFGKTGFKSNTDEIVAFTLEALGDGKITQDEWGELLRLIGKVKSGAEKK